MSPTLKNAMADFTQEIEKMQAELADYTQRPGHSPKFATFKRVRLQIMQNLMDCLQDYMALNESLQNEEQAKITRLETAVFKLEAICLLHGLGPSIFTYLQMDEKTLALLVKQCYGEGWRQTPLELLRGYESRQPEYAQKPLNWTILEQLARRGEINPLKLVGKA